MKIQVIGSKPGVKILDNVDTHMFINGASHLQQFKHKDISSAMTGQNVMSPQGNNTQNIVYESLKGKKFKSLYLIAFQNEQLDDLTIRNIPCSYDELIKIERRDKTEIELKANSNIYKFTINVFRVPGPSLLAKFLYARHVIKRKELKLSTGLFSVIYLLEKIPHSEIIISGIGFGKSEYWYGSENKLRGHFLNDYAFLSSIPKNNMFWKRVSTTENQLSVLFGIRQFTI